MSASNDKLFLKAVRREAVPRRPLWIMRQAGRYLPEYREFRQKHSFKELAGEAGLAAEVTLMPLKRYPLDAAIVVVEQTHKKLEERSRAGVLPPTLAVRLTGQPRPVPGATMLIAEDGTRTDVREEIPADLAEALAAKPGATAAFEKASPSARKEFVRQVVEAKAAETRARRIVGIVAKLGG